MQPILSKSKLQCTKREMKTSINCQLTTRFNEIIEDLNESRRRPINLVRPIPNRLYKKLKRVIDFNQVGKQEEEAIDPMMDVEGPAEGGAVAGAPKEMTFKEKIEAADNQYYHDNKFLIEPRPEPRNYVELPYNWMAKYLRETDKERVKWETKLYKTKMNFTGKTFDDKTEEKIDYSADGFANYLIELGQGQEDPKNNMDKDVIKQLFSLFIEGDAANSLNIQPKPYTTIAKTVADSWGVPQMEAQNAVSRIIECEETYKNHPLKYVSFGKSMPKKGRVPRFDDCSKEIKTDTTDGIHGFKSIKTVCDYLKKYPEIQRPEFFTDQAYFTFINVKAGMKRSPYQQ